MNHGLRRGGMLTWSAQSRLWARSFASAGRSAVPTSRSSSYLNISEIGKKLLASSSHIPEALCSHSNPNYRAAALVRAHAGSPPAGIAALHMDLLRYTDRGCLSLQVRSIHAARRDWRKVESASRHYKRCVGTSCLLPETAPV